MAVHVFTMVFLITFVTSQDLSTDNLSTVETGSGDIDQSIYTANDNVSITLAITEPDNVDVSTTMTLETFTFKTTQIDSDKSNSMLDNSTDEILRTNKPYSETHLTSEPPVQTTSTTSSDKESTVMNNLITNGISTERSPMVQTTLLETSSGFQTDFPELTTAAVTSLSNVVTLGVTSLETSSGIQTDIPELTTATVTSLSTVVTSLETQSGSSVPASLTTDSNSSITTTTPYATQSESLTILTPKTSQSASSIPTSSVTQPTASISTSNTSKPASTEATATYSEATTDENANSTVSVMDNETNSANGHEESGDLMLHLAFIIPSALIIIIILIAVFISIFCLRRSIKRKETHITEDSYDVRRNKSNGPASFMQQNINALARQFNSRDSALPSSILNNRFNMDRIEEISLNEVNETKINNKQSSNNQNYYSSQSSVEDTSQQLIQNHETSFQKSQDSVFTSNESIPPLPLKCKTFGASNELFVGKQSDYDSLKVADLPIKQRKGSSAKNILNEISSSGHNPNYDVLPLKNISLHKEDNQETIKSFETKGENKMNNDPINNNLDLPSSLSNSMDNVFQDELCDEMADTEEQRLKRIPHKHSSDLFGPHVRVDREPSFIALPRAASGSLRTAL